MSTVTDQVATLLADRFGVEAGEARADARMRDLDLDSLTLVEFALVAEKEFGVKLAEDEVNLDHTIGDVATLIDTKLSENKALQ
ncbi:phosphopantetheine-binding protein [Streptomyces sp. NPDC021096]|uniref:acyl carrier protein n=1 Tax=Streptomyces sp. NPDC021096 TaxID=3154792 RepID=UPI0033CBEC93